jgi:hypothetical protein
MNTLHSSSLSQNDSNVCEVVIESEMTGRKGLRTHYENAGFLPSDHIPIEYINYQNEPVGCSKVCVVSCLISNIRMDYRDDLFSVLSNSNLLSGVDVTACICFLFLQLNRQCAKRFNGTKCSSAF